MTFKSIICEDLGDLRAKENLDKRLKVQIYCFLIPFLLPELYRFKMSNFKCKSARKICRNQSKSIKFVTSCAGHVDGTKK